MKSHLKDEKKKIYVFLHVYFSALCLSYCQAAPWKCQIMKNRDNQKCFLRQ